MAKNKRATKDGSKGNTKKKTGGKSQQNQLDDTAPTTTNSARLIRLFPLDADTALEYLVTLAPLLAVAMWLGFSVGVGWVNVGWDEAWRLRVASGLRTTTVYQLATFQPGKWQELSANTIQSAATWTRDYERPAKVRDFERNPSHPQAFTMLREAVVREKGGFVHDDLGFLAPAPCGAARGLGMVRDSFHNCQTRCFPGTWQEKTKANQTAVPPGDTAVFKQEEVLIKVPLAFQMTRQVALNTLLTLIPAHIQQMANLHTLDDAALLVLLLAHERGIGRLSRWFPYIVTLPHYPSCGYHRSVRPQILDMLEVLEAEYEVETSGWTTELAKAAQYATKIAESLSRDYGAFLKIPPGITSVQNLEWALCQVASRATAGHEKHGSLRLVPLMDMINHDQTAGGFVELKGNESYAAGDFIETTESDEGAFVVRSLRNGRRRPLKLGQELLVNYNVPHYAPLDWLISTGFVPPERWGKWHKVDRVWPPQRWNSVPDGAQPTAEQWNRDKPTILKSLSETDPRDLM